jgi:hypothetical protein
LVVVMALIAAIAGVVVAAPTGHTTAALVIALVAGVGFLPPSARSRECGR